MIDRVKELGKRMASEAQLTSLRQSEKPGCDHKITNRLKNVKDIFLAISNHLAAMHPMSGGSEGGGGGSKSTAAIPMLEEGISEMAWAAWRATYERWAVACKLTDKNMENRVFECIPNALADHIVVDLTENENKEALLEKIKSAIVKKRSVILYRKDLHQLTQGPGEDPERYVARIKQAVPACCFTTDSGTGN